MQNSPRKFQDHERIARELIETLRAHCFENKIPHEMLAAKSDVSVFFITRIFDYRYVPKLYVLIKLVTAADCKITIEPRYDINRT